MRKLYTTIVTLLLVFSQISCAKYSAAPLCDLSIQSESQGVGIAAKALTAEESKKYLDKNLLKMGIQPIQLYIENNSDEIYIFDPKTINLSLVPPEKIAAQLHTSTFMRSAIWSFLSVPLLKTTVLMMTDSPHGSNIPAYIAAGGVISIPVSQGVSSAVANTKLDRDYAEKSAHQVTIEPHSSLNCVIFVYKHHFNPSFTLTLKDQEKDQSVNLKTTVS